MVSLLLPIVLCRANQLAATASSAGLGKVCEKIRDDCLVAGDETVCACGKKEKRSEQKVK